MAQTQRFVTEVSAARTYSTHLKMPTTVFKDAQKKPAVNKKPALNKKPAVNKTPAADTKPATGQIVGYFRTIAEAARDWKPGNPNGFLGSHPTQSHPAMVIHVPDIAFNPFAHASLAGEVAYGNTCIGGDCSIERMPGAVFIFQAFQPRDATTWIRTIDTKDHEYAGFVSAEMRSVVPGTLFQARRTDPNIDEEDDSESEKSWEPDDSAPDTLVTQDGDVIGTFTITQFGLTTERFVSVHLMRPMSPDIVTMLKEGNLMWDSRKNNSNLRDTVYDMAWAVGRHGKPVSLAH